MRPAIVTAKEIVCEYPLKTFFIISFALLMIWGWGHPQHPSAATVKARAYVSSRCVYEGTCDPPTANEVPAGDSHGWDY